MSMVVITIEGSSGSVVRFASFLPFETLVRDGVERRFEEACPCHAQCAPAVVATLPPPPTLRYGTAAYDAAAADLWAEAERRAAWPEAEATPAPATLRSR